MFRKFIAFTLAETLIVMGIIGIVSALTLPNLNSSTGEKEKVAKVKKIYQNLTDAYGRATAVYGPMSDWFVNDTTDSDRIKRFAERITEFMKISKNCGTSTGCWSTSPLLFVDGDECESNAFEAEKSHAGYYFVILADGSSLSFVTARDGYEYRIRVDIDGPNKGKTQEGSDIFDFTIYIGSGSNGQIAYQLTPSTYPDNWNGAGVSDYYTAWVIQNENLDYLKCNNKLNWETKTSCK